MSNYEKEKYLQEASEGLPPLAELCLKGSLEDTKKALGLSNKTSEPIVDGRTPMYFACKGDNLEKVEWLIGQGADPKASDNKGYKPVHALASNKCDAVDVLPIFRLLVDEHHCDSDSSNNFGQRPIHIACRVGNLELVKYLMNDCDAHLLAPDNMSYTPLFEAATNGHEAIVDALVTKLQAMDCTAIVDEELKLWVRATVEKNRPARDPITMLLMPHCGAEHRGCTLS
jgi:ankyrin repeat protein